MSTMYDRFKPNSDRDVVDDDGKVIVPGKPMLSEDNENLISRRGIELSARHITFSYAPALFPCLIRWGNMDVEHLNQKFEMYVNNDILLICSTQGDTFHFVLHFVFYLSFHDKWQKRPDLIQFMMERNHKYCHMSNGQYPNLEHEMKPLGGGLWQSMEEARWEYESMDLLKKLPGLCPMLITNRNGIAQWCMEECVQQDLQFDGYGGNIPSAKV